MRYIKSLAWQLCLLEHVLMQNLLEHVLEQSLLDHVEHVLKQNQRARGVCSSTCSSRINGLEQSLLEHVLEQSLLEQVLEQNLLEHEHVLEHVLTLLTRTQKFHNHRRGSEISVNLLEHVLEETLLEHVLKQNLLEHVLKQNQLARADSARARARARAESDHSTASDTEIAQSSARQLYLKPYTPKICHIGK